MQTISYLGGAKLGDFVYGLMVCHYNFLQGYKADLYITEQSEKFEWD